MKPERTYTEEQALDEAALLQEKLQTGGASNYPEAETMLKLEAEKPRWLKWFSKEEVDLSMPQETNLAVHSEEELRDQLGNLAVALKENDFKSANSLLLNLLEMPKALDDSLRESAQQSVRSMLKDKFNEFLKSQDFNKFIQGFHWLAEYGKLTRTDFPELEKELPQGLKAGIGFQLGGALRFYPDSPEVYIRERNLWSKAGVVDADKCDAGCKHILYRNLMEISALGGGIEMFKRLHERYAKFGLINPDVQQALDETKAWIKSQRGNNV